jgi:hypothetical protein
MFPRILGLFVAIKMAYELLPAVIKKRWSGLLFSVEPEQQ